MRFNRFTLCFKLQVSVTVRIRQIIEEPQSISEIYQKTFQIKKWNKNINKIKKNAETYVINTARNTRLTQKTQKFSSAGGRKKSGKWKMENGKRRKRETLR